MNFFDVANTWINNAENSAVNFFSAIAPWLAPLAAMQITVNHMISKLEFSGFIAWATGAVVEILGLATISTALKFWKHNQKYKAEKNQQPVWIAIAAFSAYLLIVLTVVVLLEIPFANANYTIAAKITAKALLALLSVPAAVTLAIRAQHTELLTDLRTPVRISQQKPANEPAKSEPATLKCEICGATHGKNGKPITTQAALNAHMKAHRKGQANEQ